MSPTTALSSDPGGDPDSVHGGRGTLLVVVDGVTERGHVLDQRAAERHVHQLMAAGDTEDRQARLERGPDQRQFEVVPFGIDAVDLRGRGLAIPTGLDVAAAGNQEAVDALERRGDEVGAQHRQDDRHSPGVDHAVDVVPVGEVGAATSVT